MKIDIDASDLSSNKAGIGVYAHGLILGLVTNYPDVTFYLYTYNHSNLEEFTSYKNCRIIDLPSDNANFRWMLKVAFNVRKLDYDFFLSPSKFIFSVIVPRSIQIVHDLFPLKYKANWSRSARIKFRIHTKLATYFTTYFLTNSQDTRKKFIEHFPYTKEKTFYIGTGIPHWTKKSKSSEKDVASVKAAFGVKGKYFFSVSTLEPRKNYEKTIEGFSIFLKENPDFEYVIAGKKGWFYEKIFEAVSSLGVEDKVHLIGYTEQDDVMRFIDGAEAILYISKDEGAGIPPLEALSRGVPVVISDIPVHREFIAEQGIYAHPESAKDIAKKMEEVIKFDEAGLTTSQKTMYNWNTVATNVMEILLDKER